MAAVLDAVWGAFRASLLDLNFLYFSMGFLSVAGLSIAAWLTRRANGAASSRFAVHAERMRAALPAIAVLSVTTIFAGMQGGLEHLVQAWHGWDFTPYVYALEGNLAERFQDALRSKWLDWPLVAVYTTGAFLLYYVPFFTLVVQGRARSAMRLAATVAAIWAVGILAYFFLPVYEVWVTSGAPYHYGQVDNVLFDYVPSARGPHYMTAINNNLPSLHTAISSGIAASLFFAREKWLWRVSIIVATGIAIATVYLGIHWFLDVATGLALAWGAAYLVHRRFPAEPAAPAQSS